MTEIYTLEQLRKMKALDGDKQLMFIPQIKKFLESEFNNRLETIKEIINSDSYTRLEEDSKDGEKFFDIIIIKKDVFDNALSKLNTDNQKKENEVNKSG